MATEAVLLQQFARFPAVGKVKTRLQRELTATQAYDVHCELMALTAENLLSCQLGPVQLWLDSDGDHPHVDHCLSLGLEGPWRQRGRDLGERMHYALQAGLSRSATVLLTGSDCPGLDRAYLEDASRRLEEVDVVLGAADDGGYVLIGCRRICTAVFDTISWGGESVLTATQERLSALGWSYSTLPSRLDIDTPEDLRRWRG